MAEQESSQSGQKKRVHHFGWRISSRSRNTKFHSPHLGTEACKDFYAAWSTINSFFNWVLFMAARMDEMAKHAYDVLCETEHDETKRRQMQQEWGKRSGMVDELGKNRQFFIEVILVRHMENYLQYLSSLLFEIFTQRPETLKSSERVEVAYVLSYQSIEDFVRAYAEKRVEALSYSSFEELSAFFNDRFRLELFPAEEIPTIVEAIETRNISVHARCAISRRYVARTGSDPSLIGKKKNLNIAHLDTLVPLLAKSVKALDKAARRKLNLKGIRFKRGPVAHQVG